MNLKNFALIIIFFLTHYELRAQTPAACLQLKFHSLYQSDDNFETWYKDHKHRKVMFQFSISCSDVTLAGWADKSPLKWSYYEADPSFIKLNALTDQYIQSSKITLGNLKLNTKAIKKIHKQLNKDKQKKTGTYYVRFEPAFTKNFIAYNIYISDNLDPIVVAENNQNTGVSVDPSPPATNKKSKSF